MKLKCESCGEVQSCQIDGYSFGERTLEGVMFEVKINRQGKPTLSVTDSCRDYFATLNQKMWLSRGKEYLAGADEIGGICPLCGKRRVDLVDESKTPPPTVQPRKLPLKRASDLFGF